MTKPLEIHQERENQSAGKKQENFIDSKKVENENNDEFLRALLPSVHSA